MKSKFPSTRPRRRRLLDRWTPVLTMAGVAGLILWATADGPANLYAQQAQQEKTKAEYNSKKKAAQVITRPIPGTGTTVDVAGLAKIIDDEITLRWKQEKVKPSPKSDDSEFLRRVYLDLTGVVPTAEKVKEFLESKDPKKREKLVDELLDDPNFGKQQAEIWAQMMIPADSMNRILATDNLRKWLAAAFNEDKPWDKLVEELVTASGSMDENGAVTFFVANNSPDKMTGQVSKLFLGVQLQCAQCHNHPFTDWKQDEYWGMAAFFMKVRQNGNPKMVAKNGGTISVSESATGFGKGGKKGAAPEGQKIVPAKFLGAEQPKMDTSAPYRPVLAKWMTSADNPYFAKAMVNRMWAHFFGRGFVNPIDDMHEGNPATHPELLMALAEQFKRNEFDLKFLVKAIVMSETYQRTSRPVEGNEGDTELFSRMYVRTMTPEQLYDSIFTVVGNVKGAANPGPKGGFGGKKGPGGGPRDQFVRFFRVEDGADPLEYQDGIPQALRLMNSPMLNNGGKALEEALKCQTPAEAVDYLFVVTLSRHPTVAETQRLTGYVGKQKDQRTAYTDILWTLLNCSEFRLNH
jgi:hypothetical protein